MPLSKLKLALIFSVLLFTSCSETRTSDAKEAFEFWTGQSNNSQVEVLNGQYWSSAHWSYEYEVFLKLNPTKKWLNELIKLNDLEKTTDRLIYSIEQTPEWFNPPENCIVYKSQFGNSRYYLDALTGELYVFEIQL